MTPEATPLTWYRVLEALRVLWGSWEPVGYSASSGGSGEQEIRIRVRRRTGVKP